MHAVSKTRRTELLFDVAGNRLGIQGATLVGLPPGVRFAPPDTTTSPDEGVQMNGPVTFPPLGEDADVRVATFTGRGLPDADPGEAFAVFLTNSSGSSAVVMTSAGNIRIWQWRDGAWT
jgi:hypothetical protein